MHRPTATYCTKRTFPDPERPHALHSCLASRIRSVCVTVWCSVLQCVAVCCSELQCVASHSECKACGRSLQQTETLCDAIQHTATRCNTHRPRYWMQGIGAHCNALQHTATSCNTLQHIAPYCNTHRLDPGCEACMC